MIKWLPLRAVHKCERDWKDDASYMRDMINASPRATQMRLEQFPKYCGERARRGGPLPDGRGSVGDVAVHTA